MKKIFYGKLKYMFLIIFFYSINAYCCEIKVKNSYDLKDKLEKINNYDEIVLENGNYNGNFIINKSITIRSEGIAILTSNSKNNI